MHSYENLDHTYINNFNSSFLNEALNTKLSNVSLSIEKPPFFPKSPHPLPKYQRPVVVPSHSRWIDFDSIHKIEKIEFPELVTNKEFAKDYIFIRNTSIKAFRMFPTEELRVNQIAHMTGCNVKLIQRIHKFLTVWGLINFRGSYRESCSRNPSHIDSSFAKCFEKMKSNPRNSIFCSLCSEFCSNGHFISKNYVDIILCPKCFTYDMLMTQIGLDRSNFRYTEYKNLDKDTSITLEPLYYERTSHAWKSIKMNQAEYFRQKDITTHSFGKNRLDDFIEFNNQSENYPEFEDISMPYKNNWKELSSNVTSLVEVINEQCSDIA